MTRALLALAVATTSVLALGAAPASAAAEPVETGAGFYDHVSRADGYESWNVQVYRDRSRAWRASLLHTVQGRDAAGAFVTVTDKHVTRGAVLLPAGSVSLSDNGHTITVAPVTIDTARTRSTSSTSGATTNTTTGTTTLSGTFRLAGGDIDNGQLRNSFTYTPSEDGCQAADHYEDTTRRAEARLEVLGQALVAENGAEKKQTAEALLSTYRLSGTETC